MVTKVFLLILFIANSAAYCPSFNRRLKNEFLSFLPSSINSQSARIKSNVVEGKVRTSVHACSNRDSESSGKNKNQNLDPSQIFYQPASSAIKEDDNKFLKNETKPKVSYQLGLRGKVNSSSSTSSKSDDDKPLCSACWKTSGYLDDIGNPDLR